MQLQVTFTLNLPVFYTERESWVVASCPILDVHSQGETREAARKNLSEATSLFLISCFERGTLDAVLKECGFRAGKVPSEPTEDEIPRDEDYMNVPIPFLVNNSDPERQCRA